MKNNKSAFQIYSDNNYIGNEVYHSYENNFKSKNIRNSPLEDVYNKKKKSRKRPKRLESPLEMLKYFVSRTSLHGIKYGVDTQLCVVERLIWILLVIIGFYFSIKVIIQLYTKSETKRTNIVIDEINLDISQVPFPSVTICPGTRVDWKEGTKLADTLIPATNKEAKHIYFESLRNMSHMSIFQLYQFKSSNLKSTTKEVLNKMLTDTLAQGSENIIRGITNLITTVSTKLGLFLPEKKFSLRKQQCQKINVTDLLIKVLPKCELFIFNCTWGGENRNCCDIFKMQITAYGFCYTFNSLISVERKHNDVPYNTHAYGIRSGLKFVVRKENLNYPPGDKAANQNFIFMISHPKVYPSKTRFLAFGKRYNVDIKFTTATASSDVLELENTAESPCKYDKGEYKFENCLTLCQRTYVIKKCGCNLSFFFPSANGVRDCNLTESECIANENVNISEVHYSLASKEPTTVKQMCNCPTECEYFSYDDYVIELPYHKDNATFLDVHYDGPIGVRYKRDIVVSELDMLVSLGGIFGLFLGGSFLTLIEFLYCFVIGMISYVYQYFLSRKKKNIRVEHTIQVAAYHEKKVFPLLDFPVVLKQNRIRY